MSLHFVHSGSTGRVKVTLELLNKEMAEARPNGFRRDEPNQYPVLPKPDRPESSFNPLNPMGWMKMGTKGVHVLEYSCMLFSTTNL